MPEERERATGSPEPKFVQMPQKEEMLKKLKEIGILGQTSQNDRFYKDFVDKVAGQEKVGNGLALAWTLAEYDNLREFPPIVAAIVRENFDDVIDAVTPDLQVAADAKQIMEEFRK